MVKNDETENENNSLIGYDPLAWMDQEFEDNVAEEIEALPSSSDIDIDDSAFGEDNENADAEYSQSPVHLDASSNIQHVVMLHERLKKVLAANDHIEINASDVASIDTATLQLLVALKKDAVKLQKTVVFDSPSPRFIESAKLLGLRDILGV